MVDEGGVVPHGVVVGRSVVRQGAERSEVLQQSVLFVQVMHAVVARMLSRPDWYSLVRRRNRLRVHEWTNKRTVDQVHMDHWPWRRGRCKGSPQVGSFAMVSKLAISRSMLVARRATVTQIFIVAMEVVKFWIFFLLLILS